MAVRPKKVVRYRQVRERLRRQEGVVAAWQLRHDGLSWDAIRHVTAAMRRLHDGVFVEGHAPLTERQRWWAAVCTAPGTVLGHASAGALWGIYARTPSFETVIRPGTRGPQRFGALLVTYSARLEGDVVEVDGLPVTSAARTVLDLAAHIDERTLRRLVRESLRLGVATPASFRAVLARHRRRRGRRRLAAIVEEYAPLPLRRARSDAEALAVELLQAAGVPQPRLNVRIAGEEADLSWERWRLIVELDGPDFHRFPTEDARKEARWCAAGWTVRRLSTDEVYERPERLLAAATPPDATPPDATPPDR